MGFALLEEIDSVVGPGVRDAASPCPVKNTFIHFAETDYPGTATATKFTNGLQRAFTDPGPSPAGSETAGNLPVSQGQQQQQQQQPQPQPQPQPQRAEWSIAGASRKLGGSDTSITKTVRLAGVDFVVTAVPSKTKPGRGGASFKVSKGRARLQVKVNSDRPPDAFLKLSLTVGKETVSTYHNFLHAPMVTLREDWDLKGAVESDALSVALDVAFPPGQQESWPAEAFVPGAQDAHDPVTALPQEPSHWLDHQTEGYSVVFDAMFPVVVFEAFGLLEGQVFALVPAPPGEGQVLPAFAQPPSDGLQAEAWQ